MTNYVIFLKLEHPRLRRHKWVKFKYSTDYYDVMLKWKHKRKHAIRAKNHLKAAETAVERIVGSQASSKLIKQVETDDESCIAVKPISGRGSIKLFQIFRETGEVDDSFIQHYASFLNDLG